MLWAFLIKKIYPVCQLGLLFLLPEFSSAQETLFATFSTVKARPLAMGGAFTAIEDDMAAIPFNPAAYSLYGERHRHRFTFFFNPISPIVAGIDNRSLYSGKGSKADDVLLSLGLLLKSISFSLSSLEIGLLLGEESLYPHNAFKRDQIYSVDGFRQNHSHSLIGRLKLAEQVSIGASASLMSASETSAQERTQDVGISYGILLQPESGLRIGVFLADLPDSLDDKRLPVERIVDESLNVGVSYEFLRGSTLSLDVRNLGEERQEAVREFHAGFEQVLLSHVALRAGWFRKSEGTHVYSWGLGIFDNNMLHSHERTFSHPNFALNYAFVYDSDEAEDAMLHLLSLYLRL